MSVGSFWRSASSVTTTSPRALLKPASMAADCPAFLAKVTTRTRGSASRSPRSTVSLPSVEPSSTNRISYPSPKDFKTSVISLWRTGRLSRSL